jgi:D-inositol-3-phosphate glycosyltransferase
VTTALDAARNALLAATTAAGMLREDPLLLVVQASRRLPRRLTGAVSAVLLAGRPGDGVRAVAGHWLAGRREAAAQAVPHTRPRSRLSRRLVQELAVELEAVPAAAVPAGRVRARAAWRSGDLSGAVEVARAAGADRLADRYLAERQTLDPAFALPVRRSTDRRRSEGPPRALHLLTNSLPHTQSGYALRSHAVLRSQAAAGVEVTAVTRIGYPVTIGSLAARHRDTVDGLTYERLLPPRLPATVPDRASRTVALLRPVAERFGATVVHTTNPYGNGQIAAAVAAELGVPWVYEVRGLLEQTWVAGRPGPAAQERATASERFRLLRAQEAAVAASADHVVTLSRTLHADLTGRGVPAERVTVIPNAVDGRLLTLPDRSPADARADLGLPEDGFWVGTVSSLVGYEGLDMVIDAVRMLRARGLDVRACLVGDGVARPELERRARAAGIADAVLLPGRVPASEAPRWHRALDVFTVPRRDLEVCRRVTPLKPVEAMALGRPVVASDLPALAEVLEGGAGRLVPPGDAGALADTIAELRADDRARSELVAAGREIAAGRTWERNGLRYRELYERLGAT